MGRVAITGGIACGKSEVSRIIAEAGASVLDTDEVVRELQRPGEPGYRAMVDWLGASVVGDDGCLLRQKIARQVFGRSAALKQLNAILHPMVKARCEQWLSKAGERVVVVPLLFEVGWDLELDATICVSSSQAIQVERLVQRGLSEDDANKRIEAQMPVEEKRRRAGFLIENTGTLRDLEQKTLAAWQKVMETIHGKQ